jgi:NAD-dependent DNA ligase
MASEKPYLDDYEREYHRRLRAAELHQIVGTIIYDGVVTDEEIRMLLDWLGRYGDSVGTQSAASLQSLLDEIMADNVVTADERKRLFEFLESLSTQAVEKEFMEIFTAGARIVFSGKVFMFAGEPKSAPREKVMEIIRQRGGIIDGSSEFSPRVDYLIVGNLGSEAMNLRLYGAKVERALRLRRAGKSSVQILRERDFVEAILQE